MNQRQRKLLHKWFSTSRYVYNQAIQTSKQPNQKIQFQSLRNQLVTKTMKIQYCSVCYEITKKSKCCGMKTTERKLNNFRIKDWEIETPKEIRAHAVKDVVKAYKTCFSKKEAFQLKYRSKKRNIGSLGIQKQSIYVKNDELKIYSTFLKTIKLSKKTQKRLKKIQYDCRLSYNGLHFSLQIPFKKEKTQNLIPPK